MSLFVALYRNLIWPYVGTPSVLSKMIWYLSVSICNLIKSCKSQKSNGTKDNDEDSFWKKFEKSKKTTSISRFRLKEFEDESRTQAYYVKLNSFERVCAERIGDGIDKSFEDVVNYKFKEIFEKLDDSESN